MPPWSQTRPPGRPSTKSPQHWRRWSKARQPGKRSRARAGAGALCERALRVENYLHDQRRIAGALAGAAAVEAASNEPEAALRLFGAASAFRSAASRPDRAWAGPPFDAASIERWEPGDRATLIPRGRSHRRIAEDLVIAVSTADRHVANILRKLALNSRTQLRSE